MNTETKIAPAKMTPAEQELVLALAQRTWEYVADDLMTSMNEAGERLTKAIVYETIGDASRMETEAETEDERAALRVFRQRPWGAQVRFLSKINAI